MVNDQPGFYAPAPQRDSTPAAMISAIAALVIIVFAGAAVAVILAFSGGGTVAPAGTGANRTTITVITHEQ